MALAVDQRVALAREEEKGLIAGMLLQPASASRRDALQISGEVSQRGIQKQRVEIPAEDAVLVHFPRQPVAGAHAVVSRLPQLALNVAHLDQRVVQRRG